MSEWVCECVFHKYYLDKRLWLKATPFKAATLEINQPVYKVHIFSTETDNHRGEQRGHRSNTPGTQSRAVLSHLQVMNARSWSHLVQVIYSHYLCAWFCFPNLDTSFTYIKLQIPGFDICKGSIIPTASPTQQGILPKLGDLFPPFSWGESRTFGQHFILLCS